MESMIAAPDCALVAVDDGESGYLHVRFDRVITGSGGDQKVVVWTIIESDMTILDKGSDQGAPMHADATQAMHAFISFLLACADSKSEESENYGLYDRPTREWAEMHADELQMIWAELGGEYS